MAQYLPPGPLSAYLGVRNTNEAADMEKFGLLARLQQAEQARRESEAFRRDQLAAGVEGQKEAIASRETIAADRAAEREAMVRLAAQLRPVPQEPAPIAVVGPDGKPKLVSRKDAIGKEPAPKTSIAGSGSFTPQTLTFVAKQYLTGDRQAVQGFARNATARIALQNEIVDEAQRQGLTPEQTAAKMADFAGIVAGSRTVGQRAANISLAATEAVEMLDIVKETSDNFARTNFVPWNVALRAYESGTGTPEIAAFGASVNALVNVYARAINPTGVPTVSDKDHARAVLNTVQSPQQVDAVLGIIKRELEIAKKAPAQVREATRQGIAGGPREGEKNTSKSGKSMTYRGGRWEYD